MEACSLDLRQRIVHACDKGSQTRQEIADRFQVSTAFIRRLLQRRRETGSIAARPHSGGFAPALRDKHLERFPASTQREFYLNSVDASAFDTYRWMIAQEIMALQDVLGEKGRIDPTQ